jgi:predicted SAM-dependent methyltransferase
MLGALLRNLVRPKKTLIAYANLRLHVGGKARHPDWRVLDVLPGDHVDFVGPCTDLSRFADSSITEIYASHVLEHLGYQADLPRALAEFRRALIPGGLLRVSVPDLTTLCTLFLDPELADRDRFNVMRMIFGGQLDASDFHRVGLTEEILAVYLRSAGFVDIVRVQDLAAFNDMSRFVYKDTPISLNVTARKPAAAASDDDC